MKKGDILKKYIMDKYGSLSKFSKKEKYSPQHLEIMIEKKDVFHEISIGLRVCKFLKIDAGRLFCEKEIVSAENGKNGDEEERFAKLSLDDKIKEKYAELDEESQQKVLDYVEYIYENGDV